MAIDEDKIRLLLELIGFNEVDEAIASLSHMRGAADQAAESTERLADQTAKTTQKVVAAKESETLETSRLTAAINAELAAMQAVAQVIPLVEDDLIDLATATTTVSTATVQQAASLKQVAQLQVNVAQATRATKLTLADFSQNLTGLGYVVNDFASVQGDLSQRLNAVANNLPMLLAGFGGLGLALSGLVPILGIVIKNWDHIVAAFTGDTGIIKTTGSLEEMQATLKKVNDQLEAAAASRWNSLATVQEYNRLAAAQLDLERNISEEKEKQARAAKLAAIKAPDEAKEAQEKAKALQAGLGGQQNALIDVVNRGLDDAGINARMKERNSLVEEFNRLNDLARQGLAFDESGADIQKSLDKLEVDIAKTEAKMNQMIVDRRQKAVDIVGKAMSEGDAAAFGELQKAVEGAAAQATISGKPDAQLERFRKQIGRATPEGRRQQAEAAAEADQALEEQYQEAMKERVDTVEMLNDQGKANEDAMKRTEQEEQEIANNLAETRKFLEESRAKFRADMDRMRAQTEKSIDQWAKRTGRDGNADRAIENQTAAQIQAATGADEATSHNLAKRALDLQSQGIGLQQGVQFAIAELMAAANGNAQQLAALRQQLAAMIADIRRLKNQAFNEPMWMPAMQAGWGN